jgi:hypothetical protein
LIWYNKNVEKRNVRVFVARGEGTSVERELQARSAADRLGMMWQLARDAWAFKGDPLAESRLSRHIVRVYRREG